MSNGGESAVSVERDRLQARQGWLSFAAALGVAGYMAAAMAGQVPAPMLALWLSVSATIIGARFAAGLALPRVDAEQAQESRPLPELGAALAGLAAGAAATLFLPALDVPARVAITIAACAGLATAIIEIGHQGRAFRLQSACCLGQFALAWWRLDEADIGIVTASLAIFGLLAALASTGIDRLARSILAATIHNRQLARSLALENERALAADRAKTQFVAAASHDLRQPAAALSLMSNLLRQQARDPALAPMIDGLDRSVRAMNELLGQLLDLSQLETGRIALQRRRVPVDRLLDDVAREIAPQLSERGLTLRVEHCHHELDCDPVLVARMVRNLADNAIRHTDSGGISLAARVDGELTIQVSDSGAGIAPELQSRIFDEHYQVKGPRHHGLGLGLAIVRRIAALHEVEILLASAPGQGSCFTLRFRSAVHAPLAPHADAVPAAPAAARTPVRFDGMRLLLIEDDEALAEAFGAWFRASGFEVRHAANGNEAILALGDSAAFDLVVSDFGLPGEFDGLQLLDLAADRHPRAFRLLVSADIDPSLADRAAECGVRMLAKPVDPEQLKAVLAEAMS